MDRKAARNMQSVNNNKIGIQCVYWFYSQGICYDARSYDFKIRKNSPFHFYVFILEFDMPLSFCCLFNSQAKVVNCLEERRFRLNLIMSLTEICINADNFTFVIIIISTEVENAQCCCKRQNTKRLKSKVAQKSSGRKIM